MLVDDQRSAALKVSQASTEPVLKPRAEPAHALLGASVREGIRHDRAAGAALQRSSPIALAALQAFLDVARLEDAGALSACCAQTPAKQSACSSSRTESWFASTSLDALPQLVHLVGYAEQVLHVVADLVRDDVGAREIAFGAELGIELVEESRGRCRASRPAGSRTARPRLRNAATRFDGAAEQNERRLPVLRRRDPRRPRSRRSSVSARIDRDVCWRHSLLRAIPCRARWSSAPAPRRRPGARPSDRRRGK